jgi:hypothetical protein
LGEYWTGIPADQAVQLRRETGRAEPRQ